MFLLGVASSAHHLDWQLQFLQPADFDPLSVASGWPACAILAPQGSPDPQRRYDKPTSHTYVSYANLESVEKYNTNYLNV